jgi:hypothetical protein
MVGKIMLIQLNIIERFTAMVKYFMLQLLGCIGCIGVVVFKSNYWQKIWKIFKGVN